ncbi:hypothetical protein HPP92_008961 [Vanilla planifolia]|uniref:Uncharacterized protein n=1 Tax=Vanilla planifolia TaxID=51239 RepID=A0A835V494_VANPL|nr:hypothetical protein HPP92_008961 [Vanilla planifolia]
MSGFIVAALSPPRKSVAAIHSALARFFWGKSNASDRHHWVAWHKGCISPGWRRLVKFRVWLIHELEVRGEGPGRAWADSFVDGSSGPSGSELDRVLARFPYSLDLVEDFHVLQVWLRRCLDSAGHFSFATAYDTLCGLSLPEVHQQHDNTLVWHPRIPEKSLFLCGDCLIMHFRCLQIFRRFISRLPLSARSVQNGTRWIISFGNAPSSTLPGSGFVGSWGFPTSPISSIKSSAGGLIKPP